MSKACVEGVKYRGLEVEAVRKEVVVCGLKAGHCAPFFNACTSSFLL